MEPVRPNEQTNTQPSVQQTVIVQPTQPNTVYVPQYNPTSAYGAPVAAPAGYSSSDLLMTGVLSFGLGILLGSLINGGDNDWDCDWHGGYSSSIKYNNNIYVTNNTVYPGRVGGGDRGSYRRPVQYPAGRPPYNGGVGGINRPNNPDLPVTRPYRPGSPSTLPANSPNFAKADFPKPASPPNRTASRVDPARGFAKDQNYIGARKGAFGGYESGGQAQLSSDRGRASFGGNGRGNRGANGRNRKQAGRGAGKGGKKKKS